MTKVKARYITFTMFLLFFISKNSLYAQLDFRYSQYMYNLMTLNPAQTGTDDHYRFTLFHKSQWVGQTTIFNSESVTASTPILKNGMAIGLLFKKDNNSPLNRDQLSFMGSYKINAFNGLLSFGLGAGLWQVKWDENSFRKKDLNDPENTPPQKFLRPDISFGLFFQDKNSQIGLSANHLMSDVDEFEEINLKTQFTAYYSRKLSFREKYTWQPSFLYRKTPQFRYQLEVANHFIYKNSCWIGLSLRTNSDFSIQTGLHLHNLSEKITQRVSIGYAYDNTFDSLSPATSGSHEILIRVGIKPLPNPDQIRKHRVNVSPIFF